MSPLTVGAIAGMLVVLLIACIDGIANGAEREADVVHVIVACLRQPVETACRELAVFETRTECAIAVERVAVDKTMRLMCAQVDRVRR